MMTMKNSKALSVCLTLGLFGTVACDFGPKSLGNEGGDEEDTGDGDMGDGDNDGDTGDDDEPDDTDGVGGCGAETLVIIDDLDSPLEGLLTPAEYLAQVEGDYLGQLDWLPNEGGTEVTHAGTSSELSAAVSYTGGEIRLTEVELAGEFPNGQEGGIPCSNKLEIDVKLDFVTADGLFSESLVAPLQAQATPDVSIPGFYISMDMGALQGDLSEDDFSSADGMISDYVLVAGVQDGQFGGSFNVEVLGPNWASFGSVAVFIADPQG